VLEYAITFAYARQSDLKVYADNVEVTQGTGNTNFTVNAAGTNIVFVNTYEPTTGEIIDIKRVTDISTPAVDWSAGSGFTEVDADLMVEQLLKSIDELQVPALEYSATLTTVEAGIDLAHHLGAIPTRTEVWFECLAADNGYADGEYVANADMLFGLPVIWDATNFRVDSDHATAIRQYNAAAASSALTDTKWQVHIRAWR
jgi:hypothetical protein